jgi:AcrR family transcriptional regulator
MPKPKIRPIMIEAAIVLFGRSGYSGVTTRDLAKEAKVMESNVYRLFRTKDGLYRVALQTVVDRSVDQLAYYWGRTDSSWMRNEAREAEDFSTLILETARAWYKSLSQSGARMLQWALASDSQYSDLARIPLQRFEAIVTRLLTAEAKKRRIKLDVQTRAETLRMTLFQHKVTYAGPPNKELDEVQRYFSDWLQSSFPKTKIKAVKDTPALKQ